MNYSSKPSDWGFDIMQDYDIFMIALSPDGDGSMCDQLRAHNLPKPIASLLKSVGVFVNAELAESVFEFNDEDIDIPLTIQKLEELGFNHINMSL